MQEQNANQRRLPAVCENKTSSGENFLQRAGTKRQAAKASYSVRQTNAIGIFMERYRELLVLKKPHIYHAWLSNIIIETRLQT